MKNSKKINRTRRQRGYAFETWVTLQFNKNNSWIARRLGSPSTKLPDIFAMNNHNSVILAIEAKSGTSDILYIPQDQIERGQDWVNDFAIYENKFVLLAFKFSQKKNKGGGEYESRKLKYYFFRWPTNMRAKKMCCTYKGITFIFEDDGAKHRYLLEKWKGPGTQK